MLLNDADIRVALKQYLSLQFKNTNTIIIDELPISFGDSRIDIAVVNSSLHGYEIKSDRDNLDRLPKQVKYYSQVFDTVTLVCSQKLLDKAKKIIPYWWGICVPTIIHRSGEPTVTFKIKKHPRLNKSVDVRKVVELTWKSEALNILETHGLTHGFKSKPRWAIWDYMVNTIDETELKNDVRNALKERKGWRTPATLKKLYVD